MSESSLTSSKHRNVQTATDTISIIRAAFDLVNSSNPINQLANNIIRWLGRERISESDFGYFLEQSRGLAYPNEQGLAIRQSIDKGVKRVKQLGGLPLITAGSIGRSLAFTQDYAWLVTTAAVALTHQTSNFTAEVLLEVMLISYDGKTDEGVPNPQYYVDRARLTDILKKITESILLNVVNCNHTVGDLPIELKHLCVHLLDPDRFANFVVKIARSRSDMLLLCTRFQGQLLLWVLAHFDGTIQVSVEGKVLFERKSVVSQRSFVMLIKEVCRGNCRKEPHSVELSELVDDVWRSTMDTFDDPARKVSPAKRVPLYSLEPPDSAGRRGLLPKEDLYEVKVLAQRFLMWLLDLPVQNNTTLTIGFNVNFEADNAQAWLRVEDILHRSPTLLHDQAGQTLGKLKKLVFKPVKEGSSQNSDLLYEPELQLLSSLCECFPAMDDLMQGLANKCRCRICREGGSINDIKEGCLRDAGLNRFFMLIGNAIADGFGVQDAAGFLDLQDYARQVRVMLWHLTEGMIWWDQWFSISAAAALGYSPFGLHVEDRNIRANVAAQYGSNVVTAKWLDLTQPIASKQCFGLHMAEGQISGLPDVMASLFSEVKMALHEDLGAASKCISNVDYQALVQECAEDDKSSIHLKYVIAGSGEARHLITIACGNLVQRIIDPADALLAAIRSTFATASKSTCHHRKENLLVPAIASDAPVASQKWYVWSFEDLVGNWEGANAEVFFSRTLDSDLKLNIALSLSVEGCLVRQSSSCLFCDLELLDRSPTLPGRVINYEIDRRSLTKRKRP